MRDAVVAASVRRRGLRAASRLLASLLPAACCLLLAMRTLMRTVLLVAWWSGAVSRQYEPYMFAAVPLHAPVPVLRVLSPAPLRGPRPPAPPLPYATSVQHTSFTRPYADRPYRDPVNYAESRPYPDSRPYSDPRPYSENRPYSQSSSYESRPHTETRFYGSSSRPYANTVDLYEEDGVAAAGGYGRRPAASGELAVEWEGYAVPVRAGAAEEQGSSAEVAVLYARPSSSGGYSYRAAPRAAPSAVRPPRQPPAAAAQDQPVVVKIHKHKIIKS